ncbi:hypothetical protein [Halorarius halobius]|uniref:hypothetical protein n=1 Tax=Halorarius halobius TaxID=2962671 RepID=UPI0020CC18ED|nr:hypothetical protein [Halorarius halobius]
MTHRNAFTPQFEALSHQAGVRVTDPVEDVQFSLYTEGHVPLTRASNDAVPWCFPVDTTVTIPSTAVSLPLRVTVNVRKPDATLVESVASKQPASVDDRAFHVVELASTPIKLYLAADSRVLVLPEEGSTEIVFPDADELYVGARTRHEQPARTLTTTTDPSDLMTAVSEFGAALKTLSCERSWPTLRGHPPLLEFGDELDLPGGSRSPRTGVTLEVPPSVEAIFPVAPLAYYLGADVRPGDEPMLTTESGLAFDLTREGSLEATVAELLQHVFTLDCLTRTDGYYPVDLRERARAERSPDIDLAFSELYGRPLAEQLEAYLSVPFAAVEPLRPEWRLTADVVPDADHATVLPYLANELAVVRPADLQDAATATGTDREPGSAMTPDEHVDEFCRNAPAGSPATDGGGFTRGPFDSTDTSTQQAETAFGATPASTPQVSRDDVFYIDEASTATQTYVGDGFPLGANKSSAVSYRRQLELRSDAPNHISVTVVCNDGEMLDEAAVAEQYGMRDLFEFDVTIRQDLSRAELRAVLGSETDFLHYIGHVTADGLQCSDGFLDAAAVSDVNVTAFFLNGCRSFRQGKRLVDSGAVAGIVTLEDVHNSLATEIGHHVSRLLNAGWPLDGAIKLVQEDALVGRHYVVVGDGSAEIVKAEGGAPSWLVVDPLDDGEFEVALYKYPTSQFNLGTIHSPHLDGSDSQYLASGLIETFRLDASELAEFFALGPIPVQQASTRDGTTISLQWSDDIAIEELRPQ